MQPDPTKRGHVFDEIVELPRLTQPDPRVYAMPDPPTDPTTRVRDRQGDVWRRSADGTGWVKPAGRTVARYWHWAELLNARGPLTEVTDEAPRVACPEGFHWIGQPWSSCDKCGLPDKAHAGLAVYESPATSPFDEPHWVLDPWETRR